MVRYIVFAFSLFLTLLISQQGYAQTMDKQGVFIDYKNNRAMAPVRFVSEQLGAVVDWDSLKEQVVISKDQDQIQLNIGSSKALVNNKVVELDSPAIILHSRAYVPLRFVSEALGAQVRWEGEQNRVVLTFDETVIQLDIVRDENSQEYSNDRFQHVKWKRIGENQYLVNGQARVFEGTFQFVVEDGHNELLKGSIQANGGAPIWGDFEKDITIKKVQPNSTLMLILFEESPKDGRRLSELPIRLD